MNKSFLPPARTNEQIFLTPRIIVRVQSPMLVPPILLSLNLKTNFITTYLVILSLVQQCYKCFNFDDK